jgi:branched-chain amino acid transport system substrate-binding protein
LAEQRPAIGVGIAVSTSGSYATTGRDIRDGALLAINEINADPAFGCTLKPVILDPGGVLDSYRAGCEEMLRDHGIRHVIGCYTSSSRKEIIPVVEKYDALLWYPSHYEGFESCDNVIYAGAAPNQHLAPLAEWVLPRFGTHVYCIGSNYIWPWENNRIMRQIASDCGGGVVRERYLPIGSTDVAAVIRDIAQTRPDFIFNTLIGESSYAFYRAYNALGLSDPAFAAERRPVTSCSLSEPELLAIGNEACAGHIASSVYFQSLPTARNTAFVQAFRQAFGADRVTSADAESAWIVTHLLALALRSARSTAISDVKRALYEAHLDAPQGGVRVEPENNHAWLTPRIGRSNRHGGFDVLWESGSPVRPDPYLAAFNTDSLRSRIQRPRLPNLRVVGP